MFGIIVPAIAIQFIEYPYQRVAGNMCEGLDNWCYEPGWKLGIPFAWIQGSKVSAAVSTVRAGVFAADVLFCALILFLGYLLWRKIILNRAKA